MTIHIIGMGITGSMLAWQLHEREIDFTWEDKERQICAWKATTGLIYPSGEPQDIEAYQIWSRWHRERSPWKLSNITEEGAFWFITKAPPHSAHYPIIKSIGPLHLGAYPSYHLNGQMFVEGTRDFFSSRRRGYIPQRASKIVEAHGYTSRLEYYIWGWSARADLIIHQDILKATDARPTFYLRRDRFTMNYANVIPGSALYYAGSSTITQRVAKQYDITSKAEKWSKFVEETTDGLVEVTLLTDLRHGWRPAARYDGDWVDEDAYGHLLVRPMRGSGIRHAPYVMRELMQKLI